MDDLPPITGDTEQTAEVTRSLPLGNGIDLKAVRAAFGLALHMHQPTVLGEGERTTAPLISNLQYMLDHPGQGDNHNAPVFLRCYGRSADLVGALVARGRRPRLMLDYSGNLLWGLSQMGQTDVLWRCGARPSQDGAVDRMARHHVVARGRVVDAGAGSQAAHAGLASSLRRALRAVGARARSWILGA